MDILKWAHNEAKSHLGEIDISLIAAQHGHSNILEWSYDKYSWHAKTCLMALINNNIDILEWAHIPDKDGVPPCRVYDCVFKLQCSI